MSTSHNHAIQERFTHITAVLALATGALAVANVAFTAETQLIPRMEEVEAYIPEPQQMPTPGFAGIMPNQK